MNEKRPTDRIFIITMVSAFLLKLWLTSETRIIAAYAPHDALNFLEHAKSIAMGLWFGPYNDLTLIKLPFFPAYMAALQEFGIPLPIGHLITYALACIAACLAVRPLVRNSYWLSAMFVVLYFNPMEIDSDSWLSTRAQINPSLALLAISCAIALFIRRGTGLKGTLRWSLALGASFSAFWLTREEAVWMVPALVVLIIAYLYPVAQKHRLIEALPRLITITIPLLIWAIAVGAVMMLNGTRYGWYTTAENTSPEFVSAYDSLTRIDPGVPVDHRFPFPHAARIIAYRISPAARELAPSLDGAAGAVWGAYGCRQFKACGDIDAGWFIWAFRDAVAAAGYYATGAKARAYYIRLATEIDAACSGHTIQCRPKERTLAPHLSRKQVPALFANAVTAARLGVTFSQFDADPPQLAGTPSVRLDYDFIVRSVDDGFPNEPTAFDDGLKRSIRIELAHTYQLAFPIWLLLATLAVLARGSVWVSGRSQAHATDYVVACVAVAVGFASLVFVLALVDTLSFPSFVPEYLSPLFPLTILFVMLPTAIEGQRLLGAIDERLPVRRIH